MRELNAKTPTDPRDVETVHVGSTLRVDVEHRGATTRVAIGGELDLAAMRGLHGVLRDVRRRAPTRIELDLAELSLIETVTAASLIRERDDARRDGVEVRLEGAKGPVGRLIELAARRLA